MTTIRWGLAALAMTCSLCAAATARPASSTAPAAVPQEYLSKMDAQVQRPDPSVGAEQAAAMDRKGLQAVLQLGAQAEKDHPNAPNLYLVRVRMLHAADRLAMATGQKEYGKETLAIAHRMLGADSPVEMTALADLFVMRLQLKESRAKEDEAADEIRKYVARYADSNAASRGLAYATILAIDLELKGLTGDLADQLQAKYSQEPAAKALLRRLDRHPDVGRPFEAELTTLEGKKLSLPKDLAGKVVVIDFWASWCPTCVEEMPRTKKVYEKYRPKGVEFVGISLDETKEKAEKFVKANQMNWVQAFDGPASPTAQKYAVAGIPSLWVIGRDGRIVSDDARKDMEAAIEKALAAPASTPATEKPK